jgi:hypothetical protein
MPPKIILESLCVVDFIDLEEKYRQPSQWDQKRV